MQVVTTQVTKRTFQTTIVLSVPPTPLAIRIEPAVFVKMDITKFPVTAQLAMVSLLFVFFQQFEVTKACSLYSELNAHVKNKK